ncbi:MAG TPA: folylpolyglutamate synthase/dihydrofolate synthase family protein [Chloroflexota bacterium]
MDYPTALQYLRSLQDFERATPGHAASFGLERIAALLHHIGNPHQRYPSVLIAGTKGKGSTAAMLASILQEAGHRVGLYTQPHLHSFRERFQVNRQPISRQRFADLVAWLRDRVPPSLAPTTYEVATALAFQHFAEEGVTCAVVEVGLGGRLDATNVLTPVISVITAISYDHMHVLGNTLEAIAGEKAGIVKDRGTCVSAPQPEEALAVLRRVCEERRARLVVVGEDGARPSVLVRSVEPHPVLPGHLRSPSASLGTIVGRDGSYGPLALPLLGDHQWINAATAVTVVEELRRHGVAVDDAAVLRGLERVRWPGRLEVLGQSPWLVVDGAHNDASALALRRAVAEYLPHRRRVLVLGISADKDLDAICRALVPGCALVIATRSRHPRAAPAERVAAVARRWGGAVEVVDGIREALARARSVAGDEDLVVVTGSLFLVAEARAALGHAEAIDEEEWW